MSDQMPSTSSAPLTTPLIRVYHERWLHLGAAVLLQCAQMMFFLTYGPVAASTNGYYHTDANDASSLLYFIVAAVATLPSM